MRGFRDKTALRLAQEGMKVIAVDMNEAAASAVVGLFSEAPWKSWDSVREEVAYRYGGEEFTMILPDFNGSNPPACRAIAGSSQTCGCRISSEVA